MPTFSVSFVCFSLQSHSILKSKFLLVEYLGNKFELLYYYTLLFYNKFWFRKFKLLYYCFTVKYVRDKSAYFAKCLLGSRPGFSTKTRPFIRISLKLKMFTYRCEGGL